MKIITALLFCFLVALIPRTTGTLGNAVRRNTTLEHLISVDPKGNTKIRQCGRQLAKTIAKICRMKFLNYIAVVNFARKLKRKLSLVFFICFSIIL